MAKELAVVLNDGSIEAAVVCALANQRFRVAMVHAAHADAAAGRRRGAVEAQVAHFGVQRAWEVLLAGVEGPGEGAGAERMLAAIGPIALALQAAAQWDAAAVYLPMRTGPGEDGLARGTEYVQIWNELIQLPCGREKIEVVAPVLELEAWQVVDLGVQVEAPLELTWSCQGAGPEPCGACAGCKGREEAFLRAVKRDPLGVRDERAGGAVL